MSLIGRNIKKIRTIKKLSQAQFAELFNLARPSVGAYEEGRSEPKLDTIIQISQQFNIAIDELLKKELTINDIFHLENYLPSGKKQSLNNSYPTAYKHLIIKAADWDNYVLSQKEIDFESRKSRFFWPGLEAVEGRVFEWPENLPVIFPIIEKSDYLITKKLIKLAADNTIAQIIVTDTLPGIILPFNNTEVYLFHSTESWKTENLSHVNVQEIWAVQHIVKSPDFNKLTMEYKLKALDKRISALENRIK